ncbi:MAG: 50S ribosomal protein L25 [Sphaerochaetaceae bacterium]|nr:50S ribosomal protein L25 [Sphaerochaetaceae bacterium]
MNEKQLTGAYRKEDFGSAGSRRLIRAGRIPAVIYGKGENVHLSLDAKDFINKMRHFSESTLLTVKLGKKEHVVLMKDYQENVMRGEVTHVDFFEVTTDEVLRTNVSVVLHGSAPGTRSGGILEQVIYDIEVECLPKDLPESIVVDINKLGLNESIHVSQIAIPEGVKVLTPSDTTVVTVKALREEAAPAEEETEEPEVVTKATEAPEEK